MRLAARAVTPLASLCCCLASGAALARVDVHNRLVVLARPADADAITVEALSRVSGELAAAGFEIRALPVSRDADARTTVESIGRELTPVAAFAIFPGPPVTGSLPTAEIWVSNRLEGRATVKRLLVDPQDANHRAAVLAVHAVELLKASLAELWVEDRARRTALPPSAPPSASVDAPPSTGHAFLLDGVGVEAAGGLIAHAASNNIAAGWTPAVRVSMGIARGLAARLTAVGAGQAVNVEAPTVGSASVRQQLMTADVVASFRQDERVQPIAFATAGAYHLGVTGNADAGSGFVSHSDDRWAFVAGAGGGLMVGLADHIALCASVQMLALVPRPVVRLDQKIYGEAGKPAVLSTAGLMGLF